MTRQGRLILIQRCSMSLLLGVVIGHLIMGRFALAALNAGFGLIGWFFLLPEERR